ncbi:FAD-dependent oxidoreductase [Phytohabitans suffuscus]|uniref:3-oxosteroid 1-dehydrogenase n=1 Tax=Phytohabitans suffuscus TaxID=624315 RepID=A0A6F8Z0Y8_9ACTN|nr:FAD-binding protein [Phytohabitans suffuscus]BCB92057.1 3-oxosteroid 1-dehydrogenase [Phytohabitans suffuscus]
MFKTGSFDRTVEVVVVGFGNAGAVAALTAADHGCEVLVLEKQRADRRRPNSRFSGGLFLCPSDVDAATHYMNQLVRLNGEVAETDPAVVRAWASATADNVRWLTGNGGTVVQVADHGEHEFIEGFESISVYKPDMGEHPGGTGARGWGYGLYEFLQGLARERPIDIRYGASAQWLLEDAAGRVTGVRVRDPSGRTTDVGASRGVVLACGGFEFDPSMKLTYLKAFPTHFYGNPENTGDGVRMAMEVGADLWHMNACAARLVGHFPDSGYPGGVPLDLWGIEGMSGIKILYGDFGAGAATGRRAAGPLRVADDVAVDVADERLSGGIFVDRYGRRFTNELYRTHTLYYEVTGFDSHRLLYPRIPSWWVFDEARLARGRLVPDFYGPGGPLGEIRWSDDNRAEVERGWIRRAGTLDDLADQCGMDREALRGTVDRFNAGCRDGDDEFGRLPRTLVPLTGGPFYAVRMWPGGPNTQGGARRDADARVMRVTGEPIPGLYSAGEFGSVYGMLYPAGGGNIAECIAFGRIAGDSVAARRH